MSLNIQLYSANTMFSGQKFEAFPATVFSVKVSGFHMNFIFSSIHNASNFHYETLIRTF